MSDALALVGRLLLASLMLAGTLQKIADPAGAGALLALAELPLWPLWPAGLFTAIAGLGLALGVQTRPLAIVAAGYCIVTSYFHILMDDPWQMTIAFKNWTIAGGYLMLAAHGPGRYALRPAT
ncbi:DoxX family protein [Jannaschia sp. CCS1]|uniref:DoxX family protein n=1 Tax=Jannaschia sp. (strain CCS1) TaxID=290400 RepID=UPI000053B5B2|nr:DoxX family protein [Jannaschia sp. CCS1]ABD55414.1 DoxX [Jannaschia sp. CCS1]